MESLCLPATRESLQHFRTFVLTPLEQRQISPALVSRLDLILEELLTNIITYAYRDKEGSIEVQWSLAPDSKLCFVVRDWGVPFNPLSLDDPNLSDDIEARKVGGLGVFFVRQLADDVSYRREGDKNILTLYMNMVPKTDIRS